MGNEDIPQILKILKQENVKATFFFCGDWISKYPADIKTIYEEGHDIASHGDHHKYMTKLTDKQQQEEIQGVTQKIQGLLGIKIDLFRAPYGITTNLLYGMQENELLYHSVERR